MTNKAFQDQLTFVSTEMVGVTDRLNNPTGYHPLLKSDWGISDKFRGLLGNYYTPVETVNPSLASVAMINYSEVYDSPLLYAFVQMPGTSQTLGQQVVGPNEGTNRMFDVALVEQSDRTTVALTYDDAGWKSAGYNLTWPAAPNYFDATPSSARSAAASSVPPAEIEDRLSRFMGTYDNALPYARIGADPNTVATAIVNDAPIPGTPVPGIFHGSSDFVDYPIQLSAPSAHVSIREKAEDRLSLTSHYVQYVDSIPSLESVVNNPAVSENLLPNAYYLQLELQNESTIPLANGRYVNALSLKYSNDYNGSYVDWFDNLGQGQLTELNQNQFYEEYARGLNEAIFEDNLEALNTALDYTKNLFVLHTDRNMLTGDSINVSTVPFYNTIRIPADMPTGYKPEISILGDLASDPEYAADNLIDLLQYSAIENLESSNSSTLSFTQVLKKINTASGYNNPSDVSYTLHTGEYVSVYNVNNKVEQYLGAGLPDSPPLMNLPSPMGPSPAPPSLAIPENNGPLGGQLAENIEDDDFIGVQNASSLNNRVGSVEIGASTQSSMDLLSLAPKVTRRYTEVLNGRFCHLETLMFVIKKYRVHETGETLVQTFYLTNRFDGDDIVFHDSQVKTKQKYRYDIQKVTIVFGSKYSYDVYQTPNPTEKNLTGDSINVSTVPFYNTIRIPADMPTGYKPDISILADLASDPAYAADNLIDLLQYSAIENLESSNSSVLSFTQVLKKINTASGYSNPSDVSYTLHTGEYVSVYNVNNKVEQYLGAGLPDSPPLMNLPSPMGPSPAPPSLTIPENNGPLGGQLAENIEDDGFIGVQNASSLNNRVGSVEIGASTQSSMDLLSLAPNVTRRYSEVLNGSFCHLETLMFVVKKYRVHETGETLVQTFYLTNRFDGDDIVFHDSQVKTKQKYRYDIQKITLVFGSKYSYDVYQTPNPSEKNLALKPEGGGPEFTSFIPVMAHRKYQASVDVMEEPSYVQALLLPHVVGGITAILDDKPPVSPDMSFYSFRGVADQLKILLQPTTGVRTEKPIVIEPGDVELFLGEYLAQTGVEVDTIASIPELEFRSDDPVDAYQIFRITTKPRSYSDFAGNMTTVDPRLGRAGALDDNIVPNTIYYYCARSVDINGNVSNPTHIFEVEMIENAGQIFLRLEVFTFEAEKPKFTTEGRRFIYVEPALQQLALPDTQNVGQPNIYNPPNSSILGAPNISKVWGETFKIRVRSTKTGRKLDLNLTFKNTGIVNPSE
jgi:hypothetical protein